MENPYAVERIKDQKFIYDIFYEKTEANSLVLDVIREFIANPDYANLRQKHVPELHQMQKNYVLIIIVPKGVRAGHPCYNYRLKTTMSRPYILISINLEAIGNTEVLRFHGIFSMLSSGIVHEMLHELYYNEDEVQKSLSEYIEQLNKQLTKDDRKFLLRSGYPSTKVE
jgi:hypothetical protein